MAVQNAEIARILNQLADLLEIEGGNQFRVRSYREAASALENLSRSVGDMVEQGQDLSRLPGVGESIAAKIEEIVRTGKLAQLEELQKRFPPQLSGLMNVPGLGPKRVQTLHAQLGIESLEDLEKAARSGAVSELPGFGKKIQTEILQHLEQGQGAPLRMPLAEAEQLVAALEAHMKNAPGIQKFTVAGSFRRRKETIGDLDLVATSQDGKRVIEYFVKFEGVQEVLSKGGTRSSVKVRGGLQVDLRVVAPDQYGAALFYFTGSRAHNLSLRNEAIEKGLKINEYGVFRGDDQVAGETEAGLYRVFDLPYIEPELREERGEFQAARQGKLPRLIEGSDIRGDLQSHTTASDGRASLKEMAQAARELGYEYLGITDHSEYPGVVRGLDVERLRRQIDEIDRLNEELKEFVLLKGCEVDIHEDGGLALPDDILKNLDFSYAAVHSHLNLSRQRQTRRILRALENPYIHILAHPTGRRIGEREPYDIDMERIMKTLLENDCYIELNANPVRLDINDIYCKMAREMGLKVVIATDAHHPQDLGNMRFGIGQARRGWLEAGDVLNTRRLNDLMKLLKRK